MADETPTKVLDKDNDKDIHQGYYWVYRDLEKKLIIFDYQDTRGSSAPVNMLKNSKGFYKPMAMACMINTINKMA